MSRSTSLSELPNSPKWTTKNGEEINFNDKFFNWLEDHLDSLRTVCKIGDISIEITGFGYEDVTFQVQTMKLSDPPSTREIKFIVTINNWKNYIGGNSAYLEGELVKYTIEEHDKLPDEIMYKNGAFYHLLSNRLNQTIPFKNIGSFRLDCINDEAITFSQSSVLHRYD